MGVLGLIGVQGRGWGAIPEAVMSELPAKYRLYLRGPEE